jgi:hypothetical protein
VLRRLAVGVPQVLQERLTLLRLRLRHEDLCPQVGCLGLEVPDVLLQGGVKPCLQSGEVLLGRLQRSCGMNMPSFQFRHRCLVAL